MSWADIFLNISTGILSSLFVVLFLYSLRPKVEISKEVSEHPNGSSHSYGFKITNKTPYPIFDIQIILELITPKSVPGGQILSTRKIELTNGKYFVIQKFDITDKEAKYAIRVRTHENLRAIWLEDSQYLRISMTGRHALSGFYGVFQHSFFTKGDIKPSLHQYGLGMHVHSVA